MNARTGSCHTHINWNRSSKYGQNSLTLVQGARSIISPEMRIIRRDEKDADVVQFTVQFGTDREMHPKAGLLTWPPFRAPADVKVVPHRGEVVRLVGAQQVHPSLTVFGTQP